MVVLLHVYVCSSADVYHSYNEVVEPIIQLFSIITSQLICYLSEVRSGLSQSKLLPQHFFIVLSILLIFFINKLRVKRVVGKRWVVILADYCAAEFV